MRRSGRSSVEWPARIRLGERLEFFVVPTATFRILYVFLVLEHDRRGIVHFAVTEGPSAQWTRQQLVNAFPYDSAPKCLVSDRDKIYGAAFVRRVRAMGIEQVLTAPQSPWQNPYCERVIGTLRRECLDHVIVVSARPPMEARSLRFPWSADCIIATRDARPERESRSHPASGVRVSARAVRSSGRCRARLAHSLPSPTYPRARAPSAWSPWRSCPL